MPLLCGWILVAKSVSVLLLIGAPGLIDFSPVAIDQLRAPNGLLRTV
jgi:hypothetical protein